MARQARHLQTLALVIALVWGANQVCAQAPLPDSRYEPVPEKFQNNVKQVDVNEKLGQRIRTDLQFVDSTGKTVKLSDFFNRQRPVVLQLGYFRCPQICDIVSTQVIRTADQISDLTIGKDYDMIYVSIDPNEHWTLAQEKQRAYALSYNRPGSVNGFHFLTGTQEHVKTLADEIGFSYQKVEGSNDYAHPTLLTILTPDAQISRYLYGVEYSDRTLRMALIEAGQGKIGNTLDRIIMLCYHYDSYAGKYTKNWMAIMRFGGAISVILLGSFIGLMLLRELKQKKQQQVITA